MLGEIVVTETVREEAAAFVMIEVEK